MTHSTAAPPPRRRVLAPALVLCAVLVLTLCAAASVPPGTIRAYFPLDAGTMAVGRDGEPVKVFDRADLVPGTRVLAGTSSSLVRADEQRAWLATGRLPAPAELGSSTMVRDALLDLHLLTASGAPVAGWAPAWRYVWPRDSALMASALARTGHHAEAEQVLSFLQRVQPSSGVFEARYAPDGTPVRDGRRPQTDSLGWVLWALDDVASQLPVAARRDFLERYRSLLDSSSRAALALVDHPAALPPPAPDYWETRERDLTLSTAALVAAGLDAAGRLYAVLDDSSRAETLVAAAARTRAAIHATFAADGYPRTAGGSAAGVDLGVSFLLPPFGPADDDVQRVWRASATAMARPAGGLAPGASWREDGVSWTTATSSHAMTAAFVGDRTEALRWLRWLDAHRTGPGSLPEKVLADGRPASVAPLAWPAAAVVIAADRLQESSTSVPGPR